MKQPFIYSIAIFATLIAFFVIADGKDFNHETKTAANPKLETEAKSKTDMTPAEMMKPVTETKTGIKPVAVPVLTEEEAIRANVEALKILAKKETITLSKDLKNATGSITEENKVPMAVPVLTMKEAIKANKEAIKFQRNKALAKRILVARQKYNNCIHIIISIIPLVLTAGAFWLKRKKRRKQEEQGKSHLLARCICIILSVSLIAFGLLVFVPWSVFFGNSSQFSFIFQEFVNENIVLLIITVLVLSCVLLFIPPLIGDYIVLFVAGLGICIYFQAMFMNCYLGTMNGNMPEWGQHQIWSIVNLLIWETIIALVLLFKKIFPLYWKNVISIVCGIILFLQTSAVLSMVLTASKNVWERRADYFIDGSNQFHYSNEKNIIVLILDTLASNYLKICFKDSPELKEHLKDFTWYVKASSNYQLTFPSLVHELTGAFVEPAKDANELYDKLWHSPSAVSFYNQMKNAGFSSNLYIDKKTLLGYASNYNEFFSNIIESDIVYNVNRKKLRFCLFQMSGFSSAPFVLKRFFFYANEFSDDVVNRQLDKLGKGAASNIPMTNVSFYKKMLAGGILTNVEKPVFSINYTYGAHLLYGTDEKCQEHNPPFDNPFPTVKGCCYLISELIRLLKEKNIYEQTAIIILSDHGASDARFMSSRHDMTFLVKRFNERHDQMIEDDTRIQSIDILPTILQIACKNDPDFNSFDGFPALNIPKNRKRVIYQTIKHPKMPPFLSIDGRSPMERNSLIKCFYPEGTETVDSFSYKDNFIRFIPLNNHADVDEAILTNYSSLKSQ